MSIALACLAWLGLAVDRRVVAGDRPAGPLHKTRSAVMARQGMAATSQPLATATAIRVFQQGGNAVDAAIAANAVLGVVEPMSCGLGGDLFAIVWDAKTKKLYGLNASGRAPAAATIDLFKAKGLTAIPTHGPLSWSVPGCVDGWDQLRKRFGTKPWPELLAPAIAYAETGFPVSEIIAADWAGAEPSLEAIPTSAACFLPGGHAPATGDGLPQPRPRPVAPDHRPGRSRRVLPRAARRGHRPLLAVGRRPVRARGFRRPHQQLGRSGLDQLPRLRRLGAAAQRPGDRRAPDAQPARAVRPEEHGPAVGRGASPDDRGQEAGLRGPGQVLRRPRLREAAGRDPDLQAVRRPATARADRPIGPTSIPTPGDPMQADTIYMTVVDKDFNCVSLIQSNFHGFGSHHVAGRPGLRAPEPRLPLRARPEPLNRLEPRKRPFHTIIPGFVTKDGKPWLSFGLMGGDMQAQGHAQVICNMIDFGMDVQEAGDAPRFRHFGSSEPTGQPADRAAARSPSSRASPPRCAASSRPRATASSSPPAASAATRRFASTWSMAS